ncbi:zinc ABC transporter substrate-binding protein AdcA [Vagococcus penaei]|uniref:Zinc ABC transporter substrate-binding protein AdcA n=2 Tax=Vagococcus penaei TaxID=633807 RepID=A0A1Q2D854_9ENTE|nr:ZinT/AdcA family metal-binding protein [Vagococcus penaei]AQP54608.1 zinc ABC transporter substrate-binding protein AdcA [Vagococcus penaei]RSU06679.1 zinc ABC transporter substrate-binding protein AdcA [Vagococcus penaei]
MKKIVSLGVLVLGLMTLVACGTQVKNTKAAKSSTDNQPLQVMTTFYPIYDFVSHIIGEEGKVELLIPTGTEAHDYEPTAKDMAKIEQADIFVYHHPEMESWVKKAKSSWKKGEPNVIQGTKDMLLLPGTDHEHEHDSAHETHESSHHDEDSHNEHDDEQADDSHGHSHALDPHTWLAPSLAIKEVQSITKQLSELYPSKKSNFEKNAAAYIEELTTLDKSYQAELGQAKNKTFVTQHAAFGYLALEYGLTQVPIAGLTPHDEPTPAKLATLKKYIDEQHIKFIYFEENATDKIAKTLANETNVTLESLNTLEGLSEEQMKNGANYVSVMTDNLHALKKTTATASKQEKSGQKATIEKTVYNGYFDDEAVKDRPLSDYAGDWQSVYPMLQSGALDDVFEVKAKKSGDMTAKEYKAYYDNGYKTDVDKITIQKNKMTFEVDGKKHTYTYHYVGKEILTYKKGNRGVRFLFETDNSSAGPYKYVQFSDHNIAPVKTDHFHIYFGGESQKKLLEEMDNWPTYFPADLTEAEVAQEMIAH